MQRDVGDIRRLPLVELLHTEARARSCKHEVFFLRRHAFAFAAPAEMLQPGKAHRGISNGVGSLKRFSTLVVSRKILLSKRFQASEPA